MIISIHQSEHLSYLGFWKKYISSDVFVLLDKAQYQKNYYCNRNRIVLNGKEHWLTVPVYNAPSETSMTDIKICYKENWQRKYLETLRHAYSKSLSFNILYPRLEKIINHKFELLLHLNCNLLDLVIDWFGLHRNIVVQSAMKLPDNKTGSELLYQIVDAFGDNEVEQVYLSGPSGREYLDMKLFEDHDIPVIFSYPPAPTSSYVQLSDDFIPNMSILDYMFNQPRDLECLKSHLS